MNIRHIFTAIALCAVTASYAQDALQWTQLSRYAAANDSLAAAATRPAVVLMGNSITDMWPDRAPHLFKAHPGIVGRGISGQTTSQMLLRFQADVVALHPRAVVINGGINDIALNAGTYSEDLTVGNISSMAAIARASGIEPILTSVLPAEGFSWRKDLTGAMDSIRSLNERIRALAAEIGAPYVDYFSEMVDEAGAAMHPDYSDERPAVHPNARGYQVMESKLLPSISYLLTD